ncbi:ABC transporter substrate-binding protein [Acuticoccus mangrovi]|uniref:Extracellular solute-binding protein n=1 Tax=Acuticoccus mangrovi TaxID=2796142 RepID=A0A934IU42_9HYPH|nr:extracellular solute-binding protein [Acuticoccus mangrovi]MBJ3778866.1 extracellular solute-binding protein [Acuticoccus mangrovi]
MNVTLSRRRLLESIGAASLMAGLGTFGRQAMAASGELIVPSYPGRYERFWRDQLLPDFEAQTGLKTTVDVAANGVTWAANMRVAGPEHPTFSFAMMNEIVGAMLRKEGYFEPWPADKVPNLQYVHPKAKNPDNNGVAFMISPVGIAYRNDLVKTPPTGWKDLWSPEFKGKVGMFTIANSAGFMFVMTISKIFGSGPLDFDAGLAQIEKLKPFPQGDLAGALSALLTRGEILAAPLDVSEVMNLKQKGAPVSFVVPSEGMFMFDQTLDLLKNGPNKDGACEYINYMLSEPIQAKLAKEFFYVPVNTQVKLPPDLASQFPITINDVDKLIQFDWIAANEKRGAVTESWNRMMR